MKHKMMKRTLAGVMAILCVAGYMPANVGTGGLFENTAIVASAASYTYNQSEQRYIFSGKKFTKGNSYTLIFEKNMYGYCCTSAVSNGEGNYEDHEPNPASYAIGQTATIDVNGNLKIGGNTFTLGSGYNAWALCYYIADWGQGTYWFFCRTNAYASVSTAPTAKTGLTYNASSQALINAGTASNGTMQYSLDNKTFSTSIPAATDAGSYTVYYKAVGTNGYADSAVNSVNVTISKATPAVTAPTAKSLTYTGSAQVLVNAGSTNGGTLQYKLGSGSYSTAIPTAANVGTYTVYYKVVGNANYNDVAEKSVSVTIGKANSSVTAPTAKSLTYTGSAQALVNAGSANGGTLQYKLGDNGTWSNSIPTATNAGTYKVYYQVVGDSNHNNNNGGSVSVTIKKANSSVTAPTARTLTYNGSAQALVDAGSASGGTLQYSLDNQNFSTVIPAGTEAKTYRVYYKVIGDSNYNDIASEYVDVTIAHKITSVSKKEATCTQAGYEAYWVDETGQKYSDANGTTKISEPVVIPATGHNFGEPDWEWKNGNKYATLYLLCDDCDELIEKTTKTTSETREATCTESGVTIYTAKITVDGKEYIDTKEVEGSPATGHTPAEAVRENEVAPTYTADGSYDEVVYCSVCSEELSRETIVIPKLTLTHHEVVPATCTEDGSIEYWYDEASGKYFSDENGENEITDVVIPATGHTYGEPEWTWADDYSTAIAKFTCEIDGDEYTEIVESTSETTAATYTADGKIVYTAALTFGDTEYTDTKEVVIPMLTLVHHEAVAPTCTEDGTVECWYDEASGKYFSDENGENEITDVVIPATGHTYGEPEWTWADDYSTASAKFTCEIDGDEYTEIVESTSETTDATYTTDGKIVYTAALTFGDKEYTDTREIKLPKLEYAAPEITFKKNDKSVDLSWTSIKGAEKYTVCGKVNGKWKKLAETSETSYDLKNLVPGTEYTVAVVTMIDGTWYTDFSNAIAVSSMATPDFTYIPCDNSIDMTWNALPGAEKYAVCGKVNGKWKTLAMTSEASYNLKNLVSDTEYTVAVIAMFDGTWHTDFSKAQNVSLTGEATPVYPRIVSAVRKSGSVATIEWNACKDAQQYAVAVLVGGKWKVQSYTDADTTTFTATNLKPGTAYNIAICAKVNGKWDTTNIDERAVKV